MGVAIGIDVVCRHPRLCRLDVSDAVGLAEQRRIHRFGVARQRDALSGAVPMARPLGAYQLAPMSAENDTG
jgi:hypothetical protein